MSIIDIPTNIKYNKAVVYDEKNTNEVVSFLNSVDFDNIPDHEVQTVLAALTSDIFSQLRANANTLGRKHNRKTIQAFSSRGQVDSIKKMSNGLYAIGSINKKMLKKINESDTSLHNKKRALNTLKRTNNEVKHLRNASMHSDATELTKQLNHIVSDCLV